MADDEFAQVYGATGVDTGAKPEIQKTHTIDIDEDDDDALFMQLYGGSMPSEQDDAREGGVGHRDVVLNPPEIPKVLSDALEDHGHSTKRPSADGVEEESDGESDESDEEESEDDLMINLDENATDYEPSQSKFQRSFQPPGLGTGSSSEVTTIPGLGGASTRVAIGGIPRSAIPGLAVSFAAAAQHKAGPQDPRKVGGEPEPQYTSMRIEDAVFPSEWKPGLPIKLPGQTRVSPEEYKEFLSLGHGEIFSIDLDSVIDAPWRLPGTDPSDFFNFEMNMNDWKAYQDRVTKFRLEFTMKGQIQTMDQSQAADSAMWQSAMFANVENDGKDKSLQASMIDARDESYEAFVTSERPERVSWQRFGSPWDHTIVLTGFHLDFGDQKDTHASPIMNNKSKITGARPPFGGPRPPFPPRPPSMGTGPGMQPPSFMGMPPYGGQSRQTPKLGLGMDYEDQGGPQKPGGRGGRGRGRGRWGGRGPGHGEHPQEGRRESRYHDSAPERPGKAPRQSLTSLRRTEYSAERVFQKRFPVPVVCFSTGAPDVVLTREKGKNDKVRKLLEDRGIHCLEVPMVETEQGPDFDQLPHVLQTETFDWVCITSPEAASVFIQGWKEAGKPNVTIAVVGNGTGRVLEATREPTLQPQFTPSVANAEHFGPELPKIPQGNDTILYPSSAKASTLLQQGLEQRNFRVLRLNTYNTVTVKTLHAETLEQVRQARVVAIASPSALKAWVEHVGHHVTSQMTIAAIGSTSAKAAEKLGLGRVLYPDNPGVETFVETIIDALQYEYK